MNKCEVNDFVQWNALKCYSCFIFMEVKDILSKIKSRFKSSWAT